MKSQFVTSVSGDNENDSTRHFMIIGGTGTGKSTLLQAEAYRLGISYDELVGRLKPTEAQEEQMRLREAAQERKDEQRLQSVRQAVWDAWSDDANAFSRLHDVLVSTAIDDSPSRAHLKAVFMMLPATIIGKGISWSFDDTEVGDDIYQFVEENRAAVVALLSSVNG